MTEPDPFAEARALREQQVKEYGTYVAVAPVFVDGVRAFNAGDPVPVSHVERGVVDAASVAKVGTKAAAAVTSEEK